MVPSVPSCALALLLLFSGLATSAVYSGPCLENCCCKVCSAVDNNGYPYGVTTVDIQTNPTFPVVKGATCHFSIWSDATYTTIAGAPVTSPDTLFWTNAAVFGDNAAHTAPISCSCCRLSVDTSCSEQPPLASRPQSFYVVGGRPVEYQTATLVFEKGVELTTGDFIELRNDTFCGYTRPMYAKRSSAAQLTVTVDPTNAYYTINTWAIPQLPTHGCYQVCYYHSTLTTPTWYPIGHVTVYGSPNPAATVAYQLDALDVPLAGNTVTLRFKGSGLLSVFDDAVEVRTNAACGGAATVNYASTMSGTNGGLKVADNKAWCQPAVVPQITSLRPLNYITVQYSDCLLANRLYQERVEWELTLPAAATYQVCYRKGATWFPAPIGTLTVTAQSLQYVALQTLYTSTGGPTTWTRTTGWTGTNPCVMYGVRCDGTGNVVSVNLGRNNLVGPIPAGFFTAAYFQTLTYLALDENALTGTVPFEIGVLRNLKYLNLGVNQLDGTLPPSLQRTALQQLYAPMNTFSGTVPPTLASLQDLWTEFNNQMTDYVAPAVVQTCPVDPMVCSDRGSTDSGVYECGYSSITEAECLGRGCCFNHQAPLVFGGTACFTKRSAYLATNPVCTGGVTCQTLVPAPST